MIYEIGYLSGLLKLKDAKGPCFTMDPNQQSFIYFASALWIRVLISSHRIHFQIILWIIRKPLFFA